MSSASRPPTTPLAPDGSSTDTPLAAAAPPPQLNPMPWISFAGGATDFAAPFIQSVQRVAFLQGRIKDDEWIAEYASTSFTDSALEWYVGLEEETQLSWKKLRVALVQRYPVEHPKPVPPPASSPATAAPPAITDTGRIEVIRPEFGDFFGYLSQDSTGRFVVDPRPQNALKLKAVIHTNAKHQHQKIYSLKMLNASGTRFAFLGLQLVKFPLEDPDTVPETNSSSLNWNYMRDVPSCCKPLKDYPTSWQKRTPYATWEFVPTTGSKPGPYYMRKAEGQDKKARVVSAVWTITSTAEDVTELGLTWPDGDHSRGNVISEMAIDPVLHGDVKTGLHAHPFNFVKGSRNYLDETRVVMLFKPTPTA